MTKANKMKPLPIFHKAIYVKSVNSAQNLLIIYEFCSVDSSRLQIRATSGQKCIPALNGELIVALMLTESMNNCWFMFTNLFLIHTLVHLMG